MDQNRSMWNENKKQASNCCLDGCAYWENEYIKYILYTYYGSKLNLKLIYIYIYVYHAIYYCTRCMYFLWDAKKTGNIYKMPPERNLFYIHIYVLKVDSVRIYDLNFRNMQTSVSFFGFFVFFKLSKMSLFYIYAYMIYATYWKGT